MTTDCPTCLRPLPPVRDATPRTDAEAFTMTLISQGFASSRALAVRMIGEDCSRADVERVRRRLESMRRAGLLLRLAGTGPGASTVYAVKTSTP